MRALLHNLLHFDYHAFKFWLLDYTHLPHPTLHVYCGLAIQLSMCLLLGKRISHPMPLYFAAFGQLVNEIHDALYTAGAINHAYVVDFVQSWINTLLVPTLLFLLARYTPLLGKPPVDEG